jgi:hypothetical protein
MPKNCPAGSRSSRELQSQWQTSCLQWFLFFLYYLPTVTFTHLTAVVSKAVPALQATHDLSNFPSVTRVLHATHLPAVASHAWARSQAVRDLKSALAVVALRASVSTTAVKKDILMLVLSSNMNIVFQGVQPVRLKSSTNRLVAGW